MNQLCVHVCLLCLGFPPLQVITGHWILFPVLYGRSSLVICFMHSTHRVQMLHWSLLGAPSCAIWEGPQEVSFVWGNTSMPWPWVRDLNIRLATDYKESWAQKNWCFWTVVLEKTLESPLDCKEIQPVHPKGDQSWVFIGKMMLKLKLQYFGHLMWRTDSFEKTLMLGKIEGRRRRGRQRIK